MNKTIREPRQERSIEKKKRIVEAGYQLFSEVGYYGTNTAEIAKRAEVSTGIVYEYFQDKRDILLCVLEIYIERVFDPFLKLLDGLKDTVEFSSVIPEIIDLAIKTHKKNAKMHESLHAMTNSDEAVGAKFIELEDKITAKVAEKFISLGVPLSYPMEKIHLAMDIIQSFSHEFVFDKHDYIDYSAMRKIVNDILANMFKANKV